MALLDAFTLTIDLYFPQKPFSCFLSSLGIDHITSSSLYPKFNSFIEWQVKTIKTSLTTTKSSGISTDHILQTLLSMPIGPNLPSPCEILFNHSDYKPGKQVRDYPITRKTLQKAHYDKRHKAWPLSDLVPRQDVLFLSPADQTSYIEGTIVDEAQTPRSYIIEAQGCRYRCNRQHICPINADTDSPFSGQCTHSTTHIQTQIFQDHHHHLKSWKPSGARKYLHKTPYPYVLHTNSTMCHTANVPTPDHHLPNHLMI